MQLELTIILNYLQLHVSALKSHFQPENKGVYIRIYTGCFTTLGHKCRR